MRSVGPTPVKVRDIRFKMTIQPINNHQTKTTPTPITGRDALRVSGVLPTALLERSNNQPTKLNQPTRTPKQTKQTNPTSVIASCTILCARISYRHQLCVKSSVLSIALNSVISVTNQTGILSGVTTGTLKTLSEVESSVFL